MDLIDAFDALEHARTIGTVDTFIGETVAPFTRMEPAPPEEAAAALAARADLGSCVSSVVVGDTVRFDWVHCFRGTHFVTATEVVRVVRAEAGDFEVKVEWIGLSGTDLAFSGDADVRWKSEGGPLRLVSDVSWSTFSSQRGAYAGHTSATRELSFPANAEVGTIIAIDGAEVTQITEGRQGFYELHANGVRLRVGDLVPEAGSYAVTVPDRAPGVMSFVRVDDAHVRVTFEGMEYPFVVVIGKKRTDPIYED
jgi:hypothetical protein